MTGRTIRMGVLAAALAVMATGCADPLEGRWRGLSDVQCGVGDQDTVRFTVDGDLRGDGDVCDCSFDFDADPRGGGIYRLDMDFDGACGLILPDGKYDCEMQKNDTKLNCGDLGNYERED